MSQLNSETILETGCSCSQKSIKNRSKSNISIIGGVLIALMPKCPFCLLAYSSAISLCGGAGLSSDMLDWGFYLTIGLSFLTIIFILWNYKGMKSVSAALTVALGSIFVLYSKISGETWVHYYGTLVVLFGVWLNGSFYHFYHKWVYPRFVYALGSVKNISSTEL